MERHMILTLGRSGSNALVDVLNQHPELLNISEVLGEWITVRRVRDKLGLYKGDNAAYLDALTQPSALLRTMVGLRNLKKTVTGKGAGRKPLSQIHSVGLKDFATLMNREGLRDWLRTREDVKVIGLVRPDLVDRLVSWQMLRRTGVIANQGGAQGHGKGGAIDLDPNQIEQMMTALSDEHNLLTEMLGELDPARVFQVSYDDFFRNPENRKAIISEMLDFLGVPPFEPKMRSKKIISIPALEMIGNRADCARALLGTRFEGLLDSPAA